MGYSPVMWHVRVPDQEEGKKEEGYLVKDLEPVWIIVTIIKIRIMNPPPPPSTPPPHKSMTSDCSSLPATGGSCQLTVPPICTSG